MSRVGVVTDSSSCFPEELAARYGVVVAPTHLIIGKKDYRDLIDISTAEFWKRFRDLDGQLTTAAVNPGDFVEAFNKLASTTDSIVCFVVSAKLSATFQAAIQAKEIIAEKYPDLKVEVVDSKSSVGSLGFIALEAARAAERGKNLNEVIKSSQDIIQRVKYLLILESPKYLMRIGRAPEDARKTAEQLNINPIMGIVKGTGLVDMLGTGKGLKDAQHKAVEMIGQYADIRKPLHVMLHYCEDKAEIKEIEALITQQYKCEEIYLSQFSPVVVTAIGPAVAVAFYA